METTAAAPRASVHPSARELYPLITCRVCGTRHRAIVCFICNVPTPSFVVIRGKSAA